jgi:hypothetical protein
MWILNELALKIHERFAFNAITNFPQTTTTVDVLMM